MTFTPYEWQKVDQEVLRQHNWTGLLAIETGGGKSAAACLAIENSSPDVTLITAPASTLEHKDRNWHEEVRNINGQELRVMGGKNKSQREAVIDFELGIPGIYAASLQYVARKTTDTSLWRGDLLVVDETHKVATHRTTGQRAFSGAYPTDNPLSLKFESKLALSGTPIRQNFANAWATMRLLWPELDGRKEVADDNFWAWCNYRMTSEQVYTKQRDMYGNAKQATNFLSEKEEGKLFREMPCVIQHLRRERCCEYHPEGFMPTDAPVERDRIVALTPKQKRAIRELETNYMTFLEDNPLVTELTITQRLRLRQICLGEPRVEYFTGENSKGEIVEKSTLHFDPDCKSPFAEELITLLTDDIPEDEPVAVFLESQRYARVLVEKLNKAGIKAAEYSGKSKADLKDFGKSYRVLVAIASAIGTGTDGLDKVALNEVWLEIPISNTDFTQTKSRLDRMGSRGQVMRWFIKDETGYAEGRLSESIERQKRINASTRKGV